MATPLWNIWDAGRAVSVARYELSRLSYGYGELEPFLDADTARAHHTVHHQKLVDGLNRSLAEMGGTHHPQHISSILADLESVPEEKRDAIRFFGGGFENHRLFWESLVPGGGTPGGVLGDSIDVYFGGLAELLAALADAAESVRGDGWCWLVFDGTYQRLEVMATEKETNPRSLGRFPLLGLDLWEHACPPRYRGNKRAYVEAWWGVINWECVAGRLSGVSD